MAKKTFRGAQGFLFFFLVGVSPLWATGQVAKLTASNPAGGAQFGSAVSISGSTLLIGAHLDEETGDGGDNFGAAYIFERDADGSKNWIEVAKLLPSTPVLNANFGFAVALDGTTALVGAHKENGSVGGLQGAAYIFERNEGGTGEWGEVAKLTPISIETGDHFGCSVAIEGSRALIGACQDDDAGHVSGSAYIFERDEKGAWNQVVKLIGDDTMTMDRFGTAVALSGNVAVVGAPQHSHPASISGAAYIFELYQSEWIQVAKVRAMGPDTGGFFGYSLDVDGTTALFGAYLESPDGVPGRGAAYIFQRNPDGLPGWLQVAKLVASNAMSSDRLGWSVSLEGSTALVGAVQSSSGAHNGGSAFIFQRDRGGPGHWGQVTEILSDDIDASDEFGHAVSIDDGYALIGAIRDDDTLSGSGSAYVFDIDPPTAPYLSIPVGLPGVVDEPVEVPVVLSTDTAALTGTIFSIDYDSSCLDFDPTDSDFDGIPEAVTILVPAPFVPSVDFDLGDAGGEIDISLIDAGNSANLSDGLLATLAFTPTCSPAPSETISATVGFSDNSGVLFRDGQGQEYGGHREGGSVEIYAGLRGDCNADGMLDTADLDACETEVFDGDGAFWLDVPDGAFGGSAVGCDSNGDTIVDAGDLTCKPQLLAGGICLEAPSGQGDGPWLSIPHSLSVEDGSAVLEIDFDPAGYPIVGTIFSLDLDLTRLSFDPTDSNLDGIPDVVDLLDPAIAHQTFIFDSTSTESELQISIADLSAAPISFSDGPLLRIQFEALGSLATLEGAVDFGSAPVASFGDTEGRSIPGNADFDLRPLFEDDFESGDLSAWSSSSGRATSE